MVLIVKLPARKLPPTSGEQPQVVQSHVNSSPQEQELREPGDAVQGTSHAAERCAPVAPAEVPPQAAHPPEVPRTPDVESTRVASAPSKLDVLLAPSVLKHRYMRGVDKSNIVERPERIRAVLLGIAGVHGISEKFSAGSRTNPEHLAAMLSKMTMEERENSLRVFKTTRTMRLDEPEAALADIHAYASEPATYTTQTEYAKEPDLETLSTTHVLRMSHLATKAPCTVPGTLPRTPRALAADVSDATSSDGEGDERMHPCEIPESLSQGDLYLCGPHAQGAADTSDGGSREAICHALGACVEAVDRVVAAAKAEPQTLTSECLMPMRAGTANIPFAQTIAHVPAKRAFVLSRPPGHHCSGAEPSGFCWVNNVMVAAAHAYRAHNIDRVVILDIDLHHGNGTQALAWRRNADAAASDAEREARMQSIMRSMQRSGTASSRQAARAAEAARTPWEQMLYEESLVGPRAQRVFYGSLHDIESYPCENGDPDLIRNASVCLAGAHGQWIWNVHLDTHRDDAEFARLYETKYIQLLEQARRFIRETRALAPRTLVMISCGFDACTYEYPGMQRHGKHVPPQFYAWFAKDVAAFAEEFAEGKLVSVLEGGYSDRALTSGALAHNSGLADMPWSTETWTRTQAPWSLDNVMQLQKMSKRVLQAAPNSETSGVSRRSAASQPAWLVRASEHFAAYQRACGKDARPLDLASTPSTPRKATARALDAEILATPSRYTPGGHMLRDRTVRRTRSQASMVADATPTRTRARSRARAEPMPSLPPATPFKDPANLVPGALPVENTDHTTPSAVQREDNSNVLLDLMGRLHLQEPRAL